MTRLFGEMRRRGIILDATLRVYAEADRAPRRRAAARTIARSTSPPG